MPRTQIGTVETGQSESDYACQGARLASTSADRK